jgi:DNA-binding FrmR family transcriptional regulator
MDERESIRQDILNRLRRTEGQVRGLQRMIEDEKDCSQVVTQLSAIRGALDQVGFILLSHRMEECLKAKLEKGEPGQEALEDAMKLFLKLA